jgi:hypothetical protein
MKVTKAKALNATPFMRSARLGAPVRRATWRECGPSIFPRTRRRRPRKASPALIRWGSKADAKQGLVERVVDSITGGVSKWPAGPGVQGAKNEPKGVAFRLFALVTFI